MSISENVSRVLDKLLPYINQQRDKQPPDQGPYIIGLTGLQGSGKSTWASEVVNQLKTIHNLRAITVSLDDFYRTHADLVALKDNHPTNKLLHRRGQPGTHDDKLAEAFFASLQSKNSNSDISIPFFDKSAFNGEGDRAQESEWPRAALPIDVLVFEGWCIGFQPVTPDTLRQKHAAATTTSSNSTQISSPKSTCTLADHSLADLELINDNLAQYCSTFMGPSHFDLLIHLDTDDLVNVYDWRLQQERAMIKVKGSGMSEEEVIAFVKGYMPTYELCLDQLRRGFFKGGGESGGGHGKGKCQVRVLLDKDRVVESIELLDGQ